MAIPDVDKLAAHIGHKIRAQRKALKVSAAATAEISNISRVTLHRIERGEASVNMAAYLRVLAALGLGLEVTDSSDTRAGPLPALDTIPVRVSLATYPVLKSLAWQIHGTDNLTPQEAWDIYERNWRHADLHNAQSDELALIESLRQVFGRGSRGV